MDGLRQSSDLLEVGTVVVVSVELREFSPFPHVLRVHAFPRGVGVELGGKHVDTQLWQPLKQMQV